MCMFKLKTNRYTNIIDVARGGRRRSVRRLIESMRTDNVNDDDYDRRTIRFETNGLFTLKIKIRIPVNRYIVAFFSIVIVLIFIVAIVRVFR